MEDSPKFISKILCSLRPTPMNFPAAAAAGRCYLGVNGRPRKLSPRSLSARNGQRDRLLSRDLLWLRPTAEQRSSKGDVITTKPDLPIIPFASREAWEAFLEGQHATSEGLWLKFARKATELIERGEMTAAGLREVERAKADGRWDAAYDSPSTATVPADLLRELEKNEQARKFFYELDGRNRYAILYRIQDAKKPETRARRIAKYVAMLAEQQKPYP